MGHVALDRGWEGHKVKGGHVVYVCAEGQAFLPERLQALMLKLGVTEIPRLHILPVRVQLLEPRTVAGLIATFTAELPEPPVWVAFDTVSQTANGADENDANDMRDYVNAMDRIREATGAFVDATWIPSCRSAWRTACPRCTVTSSAGAGRHSQTSASR